jgi:hypothetical protein
MTEKKKGYPVLLGVTVLFTLAAVVLLVRSMVADSGFAVAEIAGMLGCVALAGTTCVIRKRFFTTQSL